MRDMPRRTISGYSGSPRDGERRLDRRDVVVPEREDDRALPRAFRSAVHAGGHLPEEGPVRRRVPRARRRSSSRPRKAHRIRPDQHRRVPGNGAGAVRGRRSSRAARRRRAAPRPGGAPRPRGTARPRSRSATCRSSCRPRAPPPSPPAPGRPRASMRSTRPSISRTPARRARSSRNMPSCWPLNQPHRRACSTATTSSARYGKCRRMSAGSVMTSAPVGSPSNPSARAGR